MTPGALDAGREPDPRRELRLRMNDDHGRVKLRVSLWLPADAGAASTAMKALTDSGLEFDRGPFRAEPHPSSADLRRLADDLDFYYAAHDGAPDLVRAVGTELQLLASELKRWKG